MVLQHGPALCPTPVHLTPVPDHAGPANAGFVSPTNSSIPVRITVGQSTVLQSTEELESVSKLVRLETNSSQLKPPFLSLLLSQLMSAF